MHYVEIQILILISTSSIQVFIRALFGLFLLSRYSNPVFQFACGRYATETRIPDDKGRWSNFDIVGEEIYLQGRTLLEEEAAPGDFESYQLARDHFKACMNDEKREELGVQPLLDKLQEFGGWPVIDGEKWNPNGTFKWWEWNYKLNDAGFGINALISFSMGADDKNASYNVIGFDQVSISLTFYERLLHAKIQKVQLDIDNLTVFLRF